jgi:hypothetical protein
MKRLFFVLFMIFISTTAFVACTGDDEGESYRVMVSADEGATVIGDNPQEIKEGENAVFDVELEWGYAFVSSSRGTYDQDTGKLIVQDVNERMNISFETEYVGYDTNEKVVYVFRAETGDISTPKANNELRLGTKITVESHNTDKMFVGWTIGKTAFSGGEILSRERSFSFVATPELVTNGKIYVHANYRTSNVFYYDPNGGVIDSTTDSMVHNQYYVAEAKSGKVEITVRVKYFEYSECASTFWNDGTFTRDGYVLKEYNTKPDGSGEGYSLGSKFYTMTDDATHPTLYCIWEKASTDFEYEDFTFERPNGMREDYSPDWHTNGVIITKYNGNEKKVTIPEKIDGKYVIAIAEDAFVAKDVETLVMSRFLLKIEDGAFKSCSSLKTIYYSDGIYSISDAAFDSQTLPNIKNLYVNATIAPRFSTTTEAAFSVKLSRILASQDMNRIIVISGSSTYRGLATPYLEALLENKYRVVNFGTTRTTHGTIYLEAMKYLAHEGDIIVYAPENSAYMMGEPEIYWKTLRDLESMYNMFRYIDISNYTGVFTAFASWNEGGVDTTGYGESHQGRYYRKPGVYEAMCEREGTTDKYGDNLEDALLSYCDLLKYKDSYYITLNNRIKSKLEGAWSNKQYQEMNKDYTDLSNETWISIDEAPYLTLMNKAFDAARSSGAAVYFGFAPIDGESLVPEARNLAHFLAYDELISSIYHIDGLMGSSKDYIFARKYCYDCAYHTNAYGRVYRTYQLYVDIADKIGIENPNGIYSKGTVFWGLIFEEGSDGRPVDELDFVKGE